MPEFFIRACCRSRGLVSISLRVKQSGLCSEAEGRKMAGLSSELNMMQPVGFRFLGKDCRPTICVVLSSRILNLDQTINSKDYLRQGRPINLDEASFRSTGPTTIVKILSRAEFKDDHGFHMTTDGEPHCTLEKRISRIWEFVAHERETVQGDFVVDYPFWELAKWHGADRYSSSRAWHTQGSGR